MSEPKTVRVEIESEDGSVAVLTGDAADVWQHQLAHAGSMAAAHGSRFEILPWVETTREKMNTALTAENARLHGLLEYNACRCDDIAEDAGHLLVWVPSEARALIGGIQIVAQQIAVSLRAACTEGK